MVAVALTALVMVQAVPEPFPDPNSNPETFANPEALAAPEALAGADPHKRKGGRPIGGQGHGYHRE